MHKKLNDLFLRFENNRTGHQAEAGVFRGHLEQLEPRTVLSATLGAAPPEMQLELLHFEYHPFVETASAFESPNVSPIEFNSPGSSFFNLSPHDMPHGFVERNQPPEFRGPVGFPSGEIVIIAILDPGPSVGGNSLQAKSGTVFESPVPSISEPIPDRPSFHSDREFSEFPFQQPVSRAPTGESYSWIPTVSAQGLTGASFDSFESDDLDGFQYDTFDEYFFQDGDLTHEESESSQFDGENYFVFVSNDEDALGEAQNDDYRNLDTAFEELENELIDIDSVLSELREFRFRASDSSADSQRSQDADSAPSETESIASIIRQSVNQHPLTASVDEAEGGMVLLENVGYDVTYSDELIAEFSADIHEAIADSAADQISVGMLQVFDVGGSPVQAEPESSAYATEAGSNRNENEAELVSSDGHEPSV